MKRKLFTLPEELANRLQLEDNQSATVASALQFYYKHKDRGRQIIGSSMLIESSLEGIHADLDAIKRRMDL